MIANTEQINRWSHYRAQLLHLRESAPYMHLCNVKDSSAHYELEHALGKLGCPRRGRRMLLTTVIVSRWQVYVVHQNVLETVNQNFISVSELAHPNRR